MSLASYAGIIAGSRRNDPSVAGNDILGDGTDWTHAKLYTMIFTRQMPMGRPFQFTTKRAYCPCW